MAAIAASFAKAYPLNSLLRAAAIGCGLLIVGCGESEAPAADLPFDFYVLSLSWSPSYCRSQGNDADPEQCAAGRDLGFVVHGLWPQYEAGWPEFCADDAAEPSRSQVDAIGDLIPSEELIRHQWRKHGTCTNLSIDAYFDTTRAAFEQITLPDLREGSRIAGDAVLDRFRDANPGIPPDGISVSCGDDMLREVRICLTTSLDFRSCPEVAERSCRQRNLEIPER